MDDVIQLRNVVVYKHASMNIYVVSLCSLLWNTFILLNIYGDEERSQRKSSSNVTFFIIQNNSKFGYWVPAEMIQFMKRAVDPGCWVQIWARSSNKASLYFGAC